MTQLLGAFELEAAFNKLPKSLAKSTLRAALKKAAKPVLADAKADVHKASGNLRDSLAIGTQLMKSQTGFQRRVGFPQVFIGARWPQGAHAHLEEFGTVRTPSHPFMRPAWDRNKDEVRDSLGAEIWRQLARAAKRLAKRAAKGTLSKTAREAVGGF